MRAGGCRNGVCVWWGGRGGHGSWWTAPGAPRWAYIRIFSRTLAPQHTHRCSYSLLTRARWHSCGCARWCAEQERSVLVRPSADWQKRPCTLAVPLQVAARTLPPSSSYTGTPIALPCVCAARYSPLNSRSGHQLMHTQQLGWYLAGFFRCGF